ncbi:hypothetical protein FRB94_005994 [Tulasnella sp. JGI-2019a]|nr:hypothetical protein FRB93_000369 [Tulasnella sp. JGI-2019a]KAG8999691.1 hypothetical protein FRB94_005994 [Tulasnella sp. JGI-2019a]
MRRLNSRTPINRLPNELLIKIFTFAIDISESRDRHVVRIRLACVSKDWSKTVFETPSLWAEISSYYDEGWNRTVLLRSKEYPLMVEYNQFHRCATEFMDLAIQVASRWKSADFRLTSLNRFDLPRSLVSLSVPQLEELTMIGNEMSVGDGIDIFSGGADRLRHIVLFYVPIPWGSRLLSGLEKLSITESSSRSCPSSSDIVDVLRRCPKLRRFELVHSGEDIYTSFGTSTEEDTVHLPLLTSFTLDLDNAKTFSEIISSVRIPACTELYLNCPKPTTNIFSNKINHLTAALLSAIQHASKISIGFSLYSLTLSAWHDSIGEVVSIALTHHTPREDLVRLIECAGAEVTWPPISASIECDEYLPFLHVTSILRRMPSIATLELTGDSDEYITQLSRPTFSDGIHQWVLPNLKDLILQDCPNNSPQLLIELSGRHHRGVDMEEGDGLRLGLPVKLEKIHVKRAGLDWGTFGGPFYTALQNLKRGGWGENIIYGDLFEIRQFEMTEKVLRCDEWSGFHLRLKEFTKNQCDLYLYARHSTW